jgi:hypothetical protein
MKKESQSAKIKYEIMVNSCVNRITGRLPILSESFPKIGLKKNCMKENTAITIPIWKSVAPRSLLANVGRIGIKIPNPIKSMKMVIKIIESVAFLFIDSFQISIAKIEKEFHFLSRTDLVSLKLSVMD